jgi:hypothetical protein
MRSRWRLLAVLSRSVLMDKTTSLPGTTPSTFLLKPGCVLLFSGLTDLERRIQETLDSFWTRCA